MRALVDSGENPDNWPALQDVVRARRARLATERRLTQARSHASEPSLDAWLEYLDGPTFTQAPQPSGSFDWMVRQPAPLV